MSVPYSQLRSTRHKEEDKQKDQQRINDLIRQDFLALRQQLLGDLAWVGVSVSANWSGFTFVNYRKDGLGYVHFRGVLVNNAGAANPAFVLPVHYRPSQDVYLSTLAGNGAITTTPFLSTEIQIAAGSGGVNVNGLPAANYYTALDGLSFLAEM